MGADNIGSIALRGRARWRWEDLVDDLLLGVGVLAVKLPEGILDRKLALPRLDVLQERFINGGTCSSI